MKRSKPQTKCSTKIVDLEKVYKPPSPDLDWKGRFSIALETPANVLKQRIAIARQELTTLLKS